MKKTRYFLFVLLLACGISLGWHPQQAEATYYEDTTFKCSDTSITVKWADPYDVVDNLDSRYYKVKSFSIYDYSTGEWLKTGISPDATSCKITGLKKGYTSYWRIYFYYTEIGYNENNEFYYDGIYVNTTPKKVAKDNFGVNYVNSSAKECDFACITDDDMTGFQLQIYQGSDKVKTFKTTSYYTKDFNYKKGKIYKYRARQYYTNSDTEKTYYGAWSSYRYFTVPSATISNSSDVRGAKITIKKISGVKNFIVYVSKKSDSGFKKTTTITVKDSSKTVRVKKIGDNAMKADQYYYIKIVPVIKVGDSTVKSDIISTTSFYNYK